MRLEDAVKLSTEEIADRWKLKTGKGGSLWRAWPAKYDSAWDYMQAMIKSDLTDEHGKQYTKATRRKKKIESQDAAMKSVGASEQDERNAMLDFLVKNSYVWKT